MRFDASTIKVEEARKDVAAVIHSEARASWKLTGKET